MKNEFNAFKQGLHPLSFNRYFLPRLLHNIKNLPRCFKYTYQRITRGYSDYDLYDLDYYLSYLLPETLRAMAKDPISYPGNEQFPTMESWSSFLLELADKMPPYDEMFDLKGQSNTQAQLEDFFKTLAPIFYHLWK